ncbi:hypothetical protein MA16_Dca006593 [Dendrobium catenatum]|uniref:Uncharacterized protein n=1 Tax=Dendrobium catenatum TaxID=906689 RepID=A0A2I0X5M2_9ASPA|nr:hypothetical protein MA16_Dca006593 [Dendrobium catenatum]
MVAVVMITSGDNGGERGRGRRLMALVMATMAVRGKWQLWCGLLLRRCSTLLLKDVPFLSDRKLRHLVWKQRWELAHCEADSYNNFIFVYLMVNIHAESASSNSEATISMPNPAVPMPTMRGRKAKWRADATGRGGYDFCNKDDLCLNLPFLLTYLFCCFMPKSSLLVNLLNKQCLLQYTKRKFGQALIPVRLQCFTNSNSEKQSCRAKEALDRFVVTSPLRLCLFFFFGTFRLFKANSHTRRIHIDTNPEPLSWKPKLSTNRPRRVVLRLCLRPPLVRPIGASAAQKDFVFSCPAQRHRNISFLNLDPAGSSPFFRRGFGLQQMFTSTLREFLTRELGLIGNPSCFIFLGISSVPA